MIAAWYDHQGPAVEVLQIGELPATEPRPGEVRVHLTRSGVNPGDVKKQQSWLGSPMAFSRIVPHSDGAGVIEAVGEGVDPSRAGRRAWVYGAQSYRPFGTAAQTTVSLESDTAAAIRQLAPSGIDRIVEVALSANADLDASVVRNGAVLAAYASPGNRPELPFWPMLFANVTIRLLGSDDFPQSAKDAAARDLTAAAAQSALFVTVGRNAPAVSRSPRT